jgi:hypothetical protein
MNTQQGGVVYSGMSAVPQAQSPPPPMQSQPAPQPNYPQMMYPNAHMGRQGLYQSLPAAPVSNPMHTMSPMMSNPAPYQQQYYHQPQVHAPHPQHLLPPMQQPQQSLNRSSEEFYPTLDSLEISGEVHDVATPSVDAAKEAARAAEMQQMNRRTSQHNLDATAAPSYTTSVHRSNSAPVSSEKDSGASGDTSAIGKMAATIGSKFADLTKLSLSMCLKVKTCFSESVTDSVFPLFSSRVDMAKKKISSVGDFVTSDVAKEGALPPRFGYSRAMFEAIADKISCTRHGPAS